MHIGIISFWYLMRVLTIEVVLLLALIISIVSSLVCAIIQHLLRLTISVMILLQKLFLIDQCRFELLVLRGECVEHQLEAARQTFALFFQISQITFVLSF